MATEAIVAKRRAEAESAIQDCVSALGAKFNVATEVQPVSGVRDLELRRVVQLERVAEALQIIVQKANEPAKAAGLAKAEAKSEIKAYTKTDAKNDTKNEPAAKSIRK